MSPPLRGIRTASPSRSTLAATGIVLVVSVSLLFAETARKGGKGVPPRRAKSMVPSSASTPSSGRAESTGPVPSPPDAVVLTVRKGARTLELRRGSLSQTFRIGLGFSPVGTKEREGDGKTPEGTYRVVYRNPGSRFHLSLALNYPNSVDAERGFAAGTITKAQRDAIVRADRRKGIPPWNSLLGGEIFIHGRGSGSDWTLGCIALDDRDMELLFDAVPPGSEVKILP